MSLQDKSFPKPISPDKIFRSHIVHTKSHRVLREIPQTFPRDRVLSHHFPYLRIATPILRCNNIPDRTRLCKPQIHALPTNFRPDTDCNCSRPVLQRWVRISLANTECFRCHLAYHHEVWPTLRGNSIQGCTRFRTADSFPTCSTISREHTACNLKYSMHLLARCISLKGKECCRCHRACLRAKRLIRVSSSSLLRIF